MLAYDELAVTLLIVVKSCIKVVNSDPSIVSIGKPVTVVCGNGFSVLSTVVVITLSLLLPSVVISFSGSFGASVTKSLAIVAKLSAKTFSGSFVVNDDGSSRVSGTNVADAWEPLGGVDVTGTKIQFVNEHCTCKSSHVSHMLKMISYLHVSGASDVFSSIFSSDTFLFMS